MFALLATRRRAPARRFIGLTISIAGIACSTLSGETLSRRFPYTAEPAFAGVTFFEPTQVVFPPDGSGRVFVTERAGRVALITDRGTPSRTVFLDIADRVGQSGFDHGLLSMAFHPRYAENGYVYLWYSTFVNGVRANRLARFASAAGAANRADPATELPLITQLVGSGGHDGGTLAFGSDGYLYLSIGDGADRPDALESRQRIDRSLLGGVIRIDVDRRPGNLEPNPHASVHPGTYSIPADNPFVGATAFNGLPVVASEIRTEFWAIGLRNPFRMSFDQITGRLWCADVGLDLTEEINVIARGGNYGWDFREGSGAGPGAARAPSGFNPEAPVWQYTHADGYSVTGGIVYRGERFPEMRGQYLFADFVSGRIWAASGDGIQVQSSEAIRQIAMEPGIVAFATDPSTGDVLMADFDNNVIRQLLPQPSSPENSPGRLVNLSARTRTGPADKTLIMGFVVASSTSPSLLVRAIGPSLAKLNVPDAIQDPQLVLYERVGKVVAANDNWGGTSALTQTFRRLGASELAGDSKDSALLAPLQGGPFTAHVTGVGTSAGNALVELYDAESTASVRLLNASVRAQVGTGDDVLILGFVLEGATPSTLLIRALGPNLAAQNVSGFLVNPQLGLFRGATKIGENDDWGGSPSLVLAAQLVGAFPLQAGSSKDAALLVTLEPGVYTIHVSGVNATSGVALAEIFQIP